MTRLVALIGAVALLSIGSYILLGQGQSGQTALPQVVGAAQAQTAEVDTSTIIEMSQGDPNAPITLIEYASFTCPHCAAFHEGPYQEIKRNYIDTGKVRLVYREVYFDRYGLWASMIARCGGPDKFFGIVDMIYKGQSSWSRAGGAPEIANELRRMGRLAGLDNDKIEACLLDGDKAQTLVAWFQQNATADDITATPSFILNGRKVSNQPYADFVTMFEEELGS